MVSAPSAKQNQNSPGVQIPPPAQHARRENDAVIEWRLASAGDCRELCGRVQGPAVPVAYQRRFQVAERNDGEALVGHAIALRDQLGNARKFLAELRGHRSAGIHQHSHIQASVLGAAETAEVANDAVLVDNGKVGGLDRRKHTVVLIGGGERHADFSGVGTKGHVRRDDCGLSGCAAQQAVENHQAEQDPKDARTEVFGHRIIHRPLVQNFRTPALGRRYPRHFRLVPSLHSAPRACPE
jgi:hypothetical protein